MYVAVLNLFNMRTDAHLTRLCPQPTTHQAAVQAQLACAALRCLAALVEWPAMGPWLSRDLCTNVFRVVQAAAKPAPASSSSSSDGGSGGALGPSGLAAIQVVTAILDKKLVPKQLEVSRACAWVASSVSIKRVGSINQSITHTTRHFQEFVMSVAINVAQVLEGLLSAERPGGLASLDEDLLFALQEFLTVFLEQHLGRVLALPASAFPFTEFVRLLGQFTLALPSARLLRRAFLPWGTLLEYLTESEAGLAALAESGGLLAGFASSLLNKLLFCANGQMLAELDEEECGGGGGGGGQQQGAGRDGGEGLSALEEEEEEEGPPLSLRLMSSGWSGGLSEQEEVIGEGVALLQSFSRLPACSQELGGRVCHALEAALQAFFSIDSSSSSSNGGASSSQQLLAHTVADCTTLLALVLVLVPASPADPYGPALRLVLRAAGQMGQARLYSRGAAFLRLQCAALVALRDLTRGLDAVVPLLQPGGALDGALGEAVLCGRQALDATVSPAPEVLQREGAALLLALSQRLPSDLLRAVPAVAALAEDAYRLAGPLPLGVQEKLLQAVALLLLPNAAARPLPGYEDEAALAESYRHFAGPLVAALTQARDRIQALDGTPGAAALAPEALLQLRRAARVLRGLCSLYAQTPKRTKAILFGALLPGLPALLPCLAHCLGQLGSSDCAANAPAASAAQSLLGLLLALHGCFGKELGPSFLTEAVELFTRLFAAPGFTEALGQQLAAAQQLTHRRARSDGFYARSVSVFILASLLRLLRQISADRSSTPPGVVPPICRLALDRLAPLVKAASADLSPLLLRLLQSLLSDHWREFWGPAASATAAGTGPGGMGAANPLSALAAAAAAAAGGSGGGAGGTGAANGGGESGKREFVSAEMEGAFNEMLLIVYTALQDTTLPPGAVRLALELLRGLDESIGLFSLPPFRASMQLPYALTVLELLLSRAHPVLREELVGLLQAMTVRVDPDWLFSTLFPQVLIKVRAWAAWVDDRAMPKA